MCLQDLYQIIAQEFCIMSVFSLESDKKKIRSESDPTIIGCVVQLIAFITTPDTMTDRM